MVQDAAISSTGKSKHENKNKENICNYYGSISSQPLCLVFYRSASGKAGGKQNVLGSSIYYNLSAYTVLCFYMGCRFGKRKRCGEIIRRK